MCNVSQESEYFIMGNLERLPREGSAWVGLKGWGGVSRQMMGEQGTGDKQSA